MKMFRRKVPVYLFTGFLESGKTTFILDTLAQDYFATGERTLLIACEEGETEYDLKSLRQQNIYVEFVNEEEDLSPGLLNKWDVSHKPKRVLIEFNGMWKIDSVMEDIYPDCWQLMQVISTVDYTTFSMYWNNMRSMFMDQMSVSDMIIFNRCDETAKKNELRRNIKLFNKKAQVAYDYVEGFDGNSLSDELPYDLDADIIDIEDDDFGIFYMDAMENPDKYGGKTIRCNCLFFRPAKYPMSKFVPGRFAMTCCADDITYLGFVCNTENDIDLPERQWITITADINVEFVKDYHDRGPVLYLKDIKTGTRPEDDLIYF
ncbi:MAG: GTPase [Lachnospiraceae bacterium]|nr:GTPase [Lachnospiraceae bacterium]